jgi:hypothetical protein
MNPLLRLLQPYPFERLRAARGHHAQSGEAPINVSIGERSIRRRRSFSMRSRRAPRRDSPIIHDGRQHRAAHAISGWLVRRHALEALDPATESCPYSEAAKRCLHSRRR